MAKFDSQYSYSIFARSVRHKARYVFEDHVAKFLRTVIATSRGRRKELPSESFLWRAQQGDYWETVSLDGEEFANQQPLPPARMKPLRHSAREGRVNPKGIPCLYLATDKETAMAEVRPWIASYISVGQFKTLKDLVLVDCSVAHANSLQYTYTQEPDPATREKAVWAYIDQAFSEPVNPDESSADYAPTQVLAEAFRSNGYGGLVYKSLLGKGFNVALFDIDVADIVNCFLYQVKSVSFQFDEAANPYSISKQSGRKKIDDAQSGAPGGRRKRRRPELTIWPVRKT